MFSRLNRHVESMDAYLRAVELNPENTDLWGDVGVEQSALGRDADAERSFRKALAARVVDAFKVTEVAAFHYLASAKYLQVLETAQLLVDARASSDQVATWDYARLYAVFATRATGGSVDALLAAQQYETPSAGEARWTATLIEFARGRLTERDVVAVLRASAEGGVADQEKLCEALYYAGVDHELRGERQLAIRYYRSALATRMQHFLEFLGARRALKRLGAGE